MTITADYLKAIAPAADAVIVAALVANGSAMLAKYGITEQLHVDWFFGQTAVETQGFTRLEENLYYTSTARLRQVWPNRFKTDKAAEPYLRNPRKLANLVYGGRLGNTKPNDGYNFRGSSMIQTTGFANFALVRDTAKIDCVDHPDTIRIMLGALEAACVYWSKHDLNRYVVANDIVGITKAIQGGAGGLDDRRTYTQRARRASSSWSPTVKDTSQWLKRGDTGDRVKAAQMALNAHGYYKGGKLDGKFGDGMEDAVKHFQSDNGLIVDGVIGDATNKKISAVPVTPADPHVTPAPGKGALVTAGTKASGTSLLAGLLEALLAIIFGRKS